MAQLFTKLLNGRTTVVFLGEAGSGKSEVAINLAIGLKDETGRTVHFFDMDQTKPLFRSRDAADRIIEKGICIHYNTDESIEDVAPVASGVISALAEHDNYVIMDVGGNEHGARMIGQFSEYLNNNESVFFFLINPYRPWSRDLLSITETLSRIKRASRATQICVISNPNFGYETTAEDIITGNKKLKSMLNGQMEISFVSVLEQHFDTLANKIEEPMIPVKLYILYPWLK